MAQRAESTGRPEARWVPSSAMKLSATERGRLVSDLYEAGESMVRARLAREHPRATPAWIEARLARWLSEKPLPVASGLGPRVLPKERKSR